MRTEPIAARAGRVLRHTCIVALGLAAIAGCGGGAVVSPDLTCANTAQGCSTDAPFLFTAASVTPQRPVVRLGRPVTFEVSTLVPSPTYQWCRKAKGTGACTEITGATGPSYSLEAVGPADDGAVFQVSVKGSDGEAIAASELTVHDPNLSVPHGPGYFHLFPRVWQLDLGEIDGSTVAVADPPLPGLVFSTKRVGSGGNPDAYRQLSMDLPLEARTVSLLILSADVVYNPARQGLIDLIQVDLDCNNLAMAPDPSHRQYLLPTIEQGGRRFRPGPIAGLSCSSPGWFPIDWSGFDAGAFRIIDGPPCEAGQACPDFSMQGAPLRIGVAYVVEIGSPPPTADGASALHFEQGLANVKVTVYARLSL